ncbi:hypothetical protein HPHPA27_0499 [Helicobacter pylori Hp A-27]|nr:hypothetical protein HPHPA27_0499 [Helicobacter pylori Hp A-27]
MGVLGVLFQMLSVPLKNEFCIKNKVKNPIVKDQRALSKAYPKSKKNQFFNHFFENKVFLPYSKLLEWDY